MPNNPNPVPTSFNFSPQQLIGAITNILPTNGALAFANPVGGFFRVLQLEFFVKSPENILQLATFSQ